MFSPSPPTLSPKGARELFTEGKLLLGGIIRLLINRGRPLDLIPYFSEMTAGTGMRR